MSGLFEELKRRNVVRVAIAYLAASWLILQVIDLVIENVSAPPWVMQMILAMTAIGFPIVLAISWAFELTPEGMKRENEIDRSQSITPQTGRRLDRIIIIVLVIALGYFIWERQATDSIPEVQEQIVEDATGAPAEAVGEITETKARSIAVLPFVNMSSDAEQEWFADGLTEEILNSLARTPDLLVAARTSSFGFKGSTDPIPSIAATLGVDHVLEGSVRRGGDRLRVTAQLIRANDGFHLWSETYDRSPDDVITIQEEIAIQIATALETAMDPDALAAMMSAGTNSVSAYNAYLEGLAVVSGGTRSGDVYERLRARDAFELATEIDPEFSAAWYQLYDFWAKQRATNLIGSGITELSRDEVDRRMTESLENAIRTEKDATTQIKYRAQNARIDLDFRRTLNLLQEYAAIRPNDEEVFGDIITLHRFFGMYEAIYAIAKDRYNNTEKTVRVVGSILSSLRGQNDSEFMRIFAHDAINRFPDNATLLYQAHRLLLWAGDIDGASRILPKVLNSELPESSGYLAELRQACAEERVADAEQLAKYGLEKFSEQILFLWLTHAIMGNDEAAGRVFDTYDQNNEFDIIANYVSYPNFDPTRYPNFMKRVAGQGFEDLPVQKLPYRCNR